MSVARDNKEQIIVNNGRALFVKPQQSIKTWHIYWESFSIFHQQDDIKC